MLTWMFFQAGPNLPGVLSTQLEVGLAGKYSKVALYHPNDANRIRCIASPAPSGETKAKVAEAIAPLR